MEETSGTSGTDREEKARSALREIGLEIADRLATSIQTRPTHQLILQKILDPIVRHILNSVFPWIVGVAICFLILLICTVVTCVIVLRGAPIAPIAIAASLIQ